MLTNILQPTHLINPPWPLHSSVLGPEETTRSSRASAWYSSSVSSISSAARFSRRCSARQRSGNWQHRWRALEQPRERDLARCRSVGLGDVRERGSAVAAQWEVRHEQDLLLGAVVDHVLVPALGEVVVVLDGGDRQDLTRSLDLLDGDLGDADVPDLALVAVLPNNRQARLQRRLGIDTVEVVESI